MIALVLILLFTPLAQAADKNVPDSDTTQYIELVSKLKNQPAEVQLDEYKKFLNEHPRSSYKEEIESNIRNLESFVLSADPEQQKEKKDTDRYLKAVQFSKKLSTEDQISLWEQFLEENPKSLYFRDAKKHLDELRATQTIVPKPKASPIPPAPVSESTKIAPNLAYKSRETATLLATFPGLIVPGIAHWYANDNVTAAILTALRLAGIASGLPGILKHNVPMIIAGSTLYGFSYLADIIDAPFAVERYNEGLEKQKGIQVSYRFIF